MVSVSNTQFSASRKASLPSSASEAISLRHQRLTLWVKAAASPVFAIRETRSRPDLPEQGSEEEIRAHFFQIGVRAECPLVWTSMGQRGPSLEGSEHAALP